MYLYWEVSKQKQTKNAYIAIGENINGMQHIILIVETNKLNRERGIVLIWKPNNCCKKKNPTHTHANRYFYLMLTLDSLQTDSEKY